MNFNIEKFISESNLIDSQPNYDRTENIPGDKPGDLMFDNQKNAYELALNKIQEKYLDANDVRDIHRELTRNVDYFEIPGMSGFWRRYNVKCNTGDGTTVLFPDSWKIHWLMHDIWTPFYTDCIEKAKSAQESEKENLAYQVHDLFECIHPFIDGNGRTGRILLNAFRVQIGLKPIIILYNDRYKYYSKIQAFRQEQYDTIVSNYNKYEAEQ